MYIGSPNHKKNLDNARIKALKKIPCHFCNKAFTISNISKHELSCWRNPINLKLCIVCDSPIKNYKTNTTCSHSCSNKHFRVGPNNGNWKNSVYTTTCFHYHTKECVVCKETNIVEVHHLDENHYNNEPSNLIPLCPTHHKYWHSKFRYLVEPIINDYIKKWSTGQDSNLCSLRPKRSDQPN